MSRPANLIVVLGLLLAACGAATGEGGSPSPSEEASVLPEPTESAAPSGAPSAPPDASPSIDPAATPQPVTTDIPLDTVVETTVEGLSVREEPGTASQRQGYLPLATVAFIIAGPVDADGHPWYRVSGLGLPYASGCVTTPPDEPISCPAFQGWVAGASASGDPWLAVTDPGPCGPADLTNISEKGFTWRLICWTDAPITFEAWWPEIPEDAGLGGVCEQQGMPAGWLHCQNINYNGLAASPEEGFTNRLSLSIDPANGLTMPERGQWLRVTGGFDHPAAEQCADLADPEWQDAASAVFSCRLQFVPTSIEPLGS